MVTRKDRGGARHSEGTCNVWRPARVLLAGVLLGLSPYAVIAQQNPHANGISHRGGFGAPVLKLTRVAGQTAAFIGGRGAWIVNDRWAIGGGAYSLIGEQVESHFLLDGAKTHLEYWYGGLELEYSRQAHDRTHGAVQILLGAGGANWSVGRTDPIDDDTFFVAEPALNVERNVTAYVRLAVGAAYRFVSGVDLIDLARNDLSGASLVVTCKLGAF